MDKYDDSTTEASGLPPHQHSHIVPVPGQQAKRSPPQPHPPAGQAQLQHKHNQTELSTSIVVMAIVATVFWDDMPQLLILGWMLALLTTLGLRSLFDSIAAGTQDGQAGWRERRITGVLLTGICWGTFGGAAILYGNFVQQVFTLEALAGIALTAYISMQASPRTLAAFLIPSLTPLTGFFINSGETIGYALGGLVLIFGAVMLLSARRMQEMRSRSMHLGAHNTELIKKLVTTRESAEAAREYAEQVNAELQQQMNERECIEERIRASEQRMSAIFDSMQDTIYQTDLDGTVQWTTPSVKHLLGYDVDEVLNRNIKEFYVCPDDHANLKHALDINEGRLQHFETRMLHKDGAHIWVSENSHYRYDSNSVAIGIEGTIRDITALNHAKEALQLEKERAQVTLGSIGDGVITTDLNGDIEYMNTVAEQSTGWRLEDARGNPIFSVFNVVDEKTYESPPDPSEYCLVKGRGITLAGNLLLMHRFRNQHMSVEVNVSPILDSNTNITGMVLVFHDVTKLRGLARKMSYQASHDSLTGLLNRREFENRLEQAIDNARREDNRYALCYLDLDNFKVVNDTCGHSAGDELLKQLTIKFRMQLREADTLARLGGDEFGILLEGCSIEHAQEVAESIRRIAENFRFVWDNTFFRIGVSIGLVPLTRTSGSLTDIMSAADSACYVAKEQGRNRIHIYQHNDEAVAERHGQMQWANRIQNVLEENRFRLYFQPIMQLHPAVQGDKTHGEILIRMLDDNNSIVGPGAFLSSAERYLLMPAIDRWVIQNTFRLLTLDNRRAERRIDTICINLSGQSLSDDRFMDFLISEIGNCGVRPGLLCFEITETAVITNLCTATKYIARLRELGCRLALDDFGVGLSSFSYLKNLPVDYLKLDGCFVQNMITDETDYAMVRAISQIGRTMNISTIAEYVENHATLQAVRDIGIDYAQGYYISKPVPVEIGLFNDTTNTARLLDDIGHMHERRAAGD
ncbi:MAG: EAL domain-containing protein [Pseudomonadota bacterium]